MNYSLYITQTAEKDINDAADYIEFNLKNPQAAAHLLDIFEQKVLSLSQFPKQHPLVEDQLLASWGVRFMQVNHYLAFYVISDESQQISVVRFLYAKSDWISLLKLKFPLL